MTLSKTIPLLFTASSAIAGTTGDTYIGHNDHGYGDRIGGPEYEVTQIESNLTASILYVTITTAYARNTTPTIGYGPLWLGQWDQDPWSDFKPLYVALLDDVHADQGKLTLYDLTVTITGSPVILYTEEFMPANAVFRTGQLAGATNLTSPIGEGVFSTQKSKLIAFDLDVAQVKTAEINAIYWTPQCGNDVIIGPYLISGPNTVSVFLTGIALIMLGMVIKTK